MVDQDIEVTGVVAFEAYYQITGLVSAETIRTAHIGLIRELIEILTGGAAAPYWTEGQPSAGGVYLGKAPDRIVLFEASYMGDYVYEYEPKPPYDAIWASYFWTEGFMTHHRRLPFVPASPATPAMVDAWRKAEQARKKV